MTKCRNCDNETKEELFCDEACARMFGGETPFKNTPEIEEWWMKYADNGYRDYQDVSVTKIPDLIHESISRHNAKLREKIEESKRETQTLETNGWLIGYKKALDQVLELLK